MSDDRSADESEDLPPPYRPWQGSGVPQPGADRPSSAPGATRRGRMPAPPVPPVHPLSSESESPQWYAPPSRTEASGPPGVPGPPAAGRVPVGARPTAPAARVRIDRSPIAPILALLAAGTSWLPWFKSPVASLFNFSGSGFERTLNAWDLPVRVLWSYHSSRGGPSLGWFVLGVAVAILVLGYLGARTAARLLGGVEAAMGILYLVQLARIVNDTPSAGSNDLGVTDLAGIGVYLLVIIGFALVVVPRD